MRLLSYLLIPALAMASADKKLPIEVSSNQLVEISATLLDEQQAREAVGGDLNGIVVVRVRVRPLTEKPVKIDRDDFTLLDTYDGQRSAPYAPSQIAGTSTLVVSSQGTRGSMAGGGRPMWGLGGMIGGGGMASEPAPAKTEVKEGDAAKPNPMLDALKAKVLPEKEVIEPIEGLLYFQVDTKKIKPKDFEMYYKTSEGKIALRFRP